jgi:hypothetical protein
LPCKTQTEDLRDRQAKYNDGERDNNRGASHWVDRHEAPTTDDPRYIHSGRDEWPSRFNVAGRAQNEEADPVGNERCAYDIDHERGSIQETRQPLGKDEC